MNKWRALSLLMVILCLCAARPKQKQSAEADVIAAIQAPVTEVSAQEGKTFLEKGLASANSGDYNLAVAYFAKAQNAQPLSPILWFNLGLAYSKTGNELVAIPFLEAYLAAEPQAENVSAVRAEISRLESVVEEKIKLFMDRAISGVESSQESEEDKNNHFSMIAFDKAKIGDIEGAIEIAKRGGSSYWDQEYAYKYYALEMAQCGNIAKAYECLDKIPNQGYKDEVLDKIFEKLFELEDFKGARMASERISASSQYKEKYNQWMASQALREGDFVPAEAFMSGTADLSKSFDMRLSMVYKQLELRDIAATQKTIEGFDKKDYRYSMALSYLAVAQLEKGDIAGAKATAKAILAVKDENFGKFTAAAVLGNIEGACAFIENWDVIGNKAYDYAQIAYIQALNNDIKAALATGQRSEAFLKRQGYGYTGDGVVEMHIGKALILKGDLRQGFEYVNKAQDYIKLAFLPDIANMKIKEGDLAAASQIIAAVPWKLESIRWFGRDLMCKKSSLVTDLAAAYAANNNKEIAGKLLRIASDSIYALALPPNPWVIKLLERIESEQTKIGDQEGAKLTRDKTALPAARRWVSLGASLVKDANIANTDKSLQERINQDPKKGNEVIASMASTYFNCLSEIRGLRQTPQ